MRRLFLGVIILLALLGIIDAGYLAQAAITNTELLCGISTLDGCNIVAQSEYSRLLGIPLAFYGLAFYVGVLVLAAVALFVRHRALMHVLVFVGGLGFLVSLYFLYLQIFQINALCIYCLASFVLSTLIFVLAVRFERNERKQHALSVEESHEEETEA